MILYTAMSESVWKLKFETLPTNTVISDDVSCSTTVVSWCYMCLEISGPTSPSMLHPSRPALHHMWALEDNSTWPWQLKADKLMPLARMLGMLQTFETLLFSWSWIHPLNKQTMKDVSNQLEMKVVKVKLGPEFICMGASHQWPTQFGTSLGPEARLLAYFHWAFPCRKRAAWTVIHVNDATLQGLWELEQAKGEWLSHVVTENISMQACISSQYNLEEMSNKVLLVEHIFMNLGNEQDISYHLLLKETWLCFVESWKHLFTNMYKYLRELPYLLKQEVEKGHEWRCYICSILF